MAGVFNEAVLTKKGIALLAKAQAGRCAIVFTKAVTGDGTYSQGEAIQNRTALKAQKQQFPLNVIRVQNQTNVYVKFIITNNPSTGPLVTGYYVTEVGLYATDPDEGEILYAIATGVSGQCDYMPSYNDLIPATITVEFLAEVNNADTVEISMPNSMYVYDETTSQKYVIGINNGLLFYEEVAE